MALFNNITFYRNLDPLTETVSFKYLLYSNYYI